MKTTIELPFLTHIDSDILPELAKIATERGIPVSVTDDLDLVAKRGTISHSYHVTEDKFCLVIEYNEA